MSRAPPDGISWMIRPHGIARRRAEQRDPVADERMDRALLGRDALEAQDLATDEEDHAVGDLDGALGLLEHAVRRVDRVNLDVAVRSARDPSVLPARKRSSSNAMSAPARPTIVSSDDSGKRAPSVPSRLTSTALPHAAALGVASAVACRGSDCSDSSTALTGASEPPHRRAHRRRRASRPADRFPSPREQRPRRSGARPSEDGSEPGCPHRDRSARSR